jgi:hypothetical protein
MNQKGSESLKVVKIILDVMSPAQQSISTLASILSQIDGVALIDIMLSELERDVEDFKVTIEGYALNIEEIRNAIKDFGGVIRNVDNLVTAEEYIPRQDSDKLAAAMLVLACYSDPKIKGLKHVHDEFNASLKYIRSQRNS